MSATLNGTRGAGGITPTDPALASAYMRAQARMRASKACGYGDQYPPLMQAVNLANAHGGRHAAVALEACEAVAVAEEPALERMVFHRRAAPAMPTYEEGAFTRATQGAELNRQHRELSALMNRPRVTLAEQLAMLEGRGIRIHAEGRHLKVHAPDGVLTDGDRTLLRENKAGILAWLAGNEEVF